MATTVQNFSSIFYLSGSALTQYWEENKTDRGWGDDDITFPDWSDAPLDPNATEECRILYLGYGVRTIMRWAQCFIDNPGSGESVKQDIQDCIDDVWDNFFLPGVAGCIVQA